ncbi:MAG: MCP four helix bundle domain-containing protein, partial [Candidatus Binatia bacterium]
MLRNTKITKRIIIGFGVVVTLVIILAVVAYRALRTVEQRMARVIQQDARIAEHSAMILAKTLSLRRYEKDIFFRIGNRDKVNESFANWNDVRSQVEKGIANLDEYITGAEQKSITERMRSELLKYQAGLSKTVERIRAQAPKTRQESDRSMEEFDEGIQSIEKLAEDLGRVHNEQLEAASYEAANVANTVQLQLKFLLLILVAIAAALGMV